MTVLFPGQGSQFIGMGDSLFSKYHHLVEEANAVLGYAIEDVCLNNYEKLKQTNYTQPAIFVVSVMMYQDFVEQWNHPYVNYLMGHSLGEYTALFVAGAFDFKTGVKLVKKRGELMQLVKNGTMAAIVGMHAENVEEVLKKEQKQVYLANHNAATQVVIAGGENDIHALREVFTFGDTSYHVLPVGGAFHSPIMAPVAEEFGVYLDSLNFNEPRLPVIANWNGRPYTGANIKENLIKQIDHPVLWDSSMQGLVNAGETMFIEVGPRNVLSKLIKAPAA
jgi:trans-AT polyketide synthase/acyltransferase/oxidoreductase domain-containing protein